MPKSTLSYQSTQSSDKRLKLKQQVHSKKDGAVPLDLSTILELPKPKRARTGYTIFLTERSVKFEKSEGLTHAEQFRNRIKELSAEWKQLGDGSAKYEELALKDKERFREQMDQYNENGFFIMADGQQSNHVVPQNPKFLPHIVQPKGVMVSYFQFSEEVRNEIRAQNPEIKYTDIMKLVAKQWQDLDDDQRQRYDKLSKKDRIRYDKQMNDLLTQGYFIMDDGTKSSDHVRKIKMKRQVKAEEMIDYGEEGPEDEDMAENSEEMESELDENDDDEASDKIKHQKSNKTAKSAKKKQQPDDEKYVEPSKPTKKKNVVEEKATKSSRSNEKKNTGEKLSPTKSGKSKVDQTKQTPAKTVRSKGEKSSPSSSPPKSVKSKHVNEKAKSSGSKEKMPLVEEKQRQVRSTKGRSNDQAEVASGKFRGEQKDSKTLRVRKEQPPPKSKKELSPSKSEKDLSPPKSKKEQSPPKSQRGQNLPKGNQEKTPRSQRENSPDQKKLKQSSETKSKSKKLESPPKSKNDKTTESKKERPQRMKRDESPEKQHSKMLTPKSKKGKTPQKSH